MAVPVDGAVPNSPTPLLFRAAALALILIALLAGLAALHAGRLFAMPTILAGLFALALAPICRRLEALGAPAVPTAFVVVFSGVATIASAVYLLAPSVETLVAEAPEVTRDIERTIRRLRSYFGGTLSGTDLSSTLSGDAGASSVDDSATGGADGETNLIRSGRRYFTDMLMSAPSLIGPIVYGVFLAAFLLAERQAVERGLLALTARQTLRFRLARAVRQVREQVSRYLLAITVINIVLGLTTGFVFWFIGMPRPAAWGAAMMVLNYMPYLGPVIMNIIVLAVGLVYFPQPLDAFWPVAVLVVLNTIEGYLITPRVVGHQVRLGPLAVFIAVAFGAWLWGAAGALIATPALIVLRAVAEGLRHGTPSTDLARGERRKTGPMQPREPFTGDGVSVG